jgi:hypothetical protein
MSAFGRRQPFGPARIRIEPKDEFGVGGAIHVILDDNRPFAARRPNDRVARNVEVKRAPPQRLLGDDPPGQPGDGDEQRRQHLAQQADKASEHEGIVIDDERCNGIVTIAVSV